MKNKIHLGLNKINANNRNFSATEIGKLFTKAIIELIENGSMRNDNTTFYYRYDC